MKNVDEGRTEYWLQEGQGTAIAFVHGIGAKDPKDYWQQFLHILLRDPSTKDLGIFVWKYPTHTKPGRFSNLLASLKRKTIVETAPTIKRLGEAWGTTYRTQFSNYQTVVLVCHSMGGLVVKSWIIDTLGSQGSAAIEQLTHISFYATPHNGAPIATLTKWNNQLQDMKLDAPFIEDVSKRWYDRVVAWKDKAPGLEDHRYNRYIPHLVLAGLSDQVVPSPFAIIQGMQSVTVQGDHSQVIQPIDVQDTRYKAWYDSVQQALRERIQQNPSLSGKFVSLLPKDAGNSSPTAPAADKPYDQATADTLHVSAQERILATLDDKAIKDHTELFGVDEQIVTVKNYLMNPHGDWIISLVGEGGIGKTALAYEIVSRYAAKAGFTRLAWVSAKTAYLSHSGDIQRKTSAEFHWPAIIKKIADQLNLEMGYGQIEWINDFHRSLQNLSSSEKCLIVVDNLETVEDIKEAVQYLCGTNTSYKTPRPHKIIITSREAVQPYESAVAETKLALLKPKYAFQLIRSLGNEDVKSASDEDLQPIVDATEGNPFLIKLCVRRFLISHLPFAEVLSDLREAKRKVGQAVIKYLYAESISLLEERCGSEAAEGIMAAFCPLGPGNSVDYLFLRQHSHIADEFVFRRALEVACNLSLIRASKLNTIYSIHSLLWNAICSSDS